MRTTKVGVIGCGYWGPNLIRNFQEIPHADLRMVCDLDAERLNHIQSRYPSVETSRDYRDLLASDVEAVAVATPVSTHHRIVLDCLRAGKHVLVEKPLASSRAEARAIVDAGDEAGKVVMVGHTFVYNPAVVALKDIISRGEIGEVFYFNCTRVNLGLYQPDINVVWDLAPHDVSILLFVLGKEPVSVSARGSAYIKPGVHDVAYLTLYFPGGILADMRLSWLDPAKMRTITVVGSKKMIIYDDIQSTDKVRIYDKGIDVQPYTDTLEEFHLAYRYGDVVTYPLNWMEPLKAECLHFLDCIVRGTIPRSDAREGLRVVEILEAAQKSLLNGGMREELTF